jgi:hypothetical protein
MNGRGRLIARVSRRAPDVVIGDIEQMRLEMAA